MNSDPPRGWDRIQPAMPPALRDRLLDDLLLQVVEFASLRVGPLLDRSHQQCVQLWVAALDAAGDFAVIRLPSRSPTPHGPADESRSKRDEKGREDRPFAAPPHEKRKKRRGHAAAG